MVGLASSHRIISKMALNSLASFDFCTKALMILRSMLFGKRSMPSLMYMDRNLYHMVCYFWGSCDIFCMSSKVSSIFCSLFFC